jgi:signal-transduction protein with cAMP-binding, CBS, and nucleotidyltransferase domain
MEPMKVSDIMTARVVSCGTDCTITEVAKKMRDEQVGSVLIVDADGQLLGLCTDRQNTHTVVADGQDSNVVTAGEIMFTDFVPLEAGMDLLVAVRLQRELAMRRLPVVENGKPVGIVSVSDISSFVKECIDCILVEGEVRVLRRGEGKTRLGK